MKKVKATKKDDYQVELEIEVAAEDLDKAYKKACKSVANKVNIPGFRKGKAPRNILEHYVGKEAILDEAFDILAPGAFIEALQSEHIDLAARPKFDVVTLAEGQDVVFTATVTPFPEVTLGEYKGLRIEKTVKPVTDGDIDDYLAKVQDNLGTLKEAPEDRAAQEKDVVMLDYKGFVDDKPFEGGEGEDYPLQLGSNKFIPGFEDQLIGIKAGEEREVKVSFPDEYPEESLAGKPAVFKCTARSIKTKELPPIDDELAKKASKFETIAEYKDDIRRILEQRAERIAEEEQREEAIKKATENITVDIPPVMIENRITHMIRELELNLERQGMTLENYLQFSGTDITKIREDYHDAAEKAVRTDLMLGAVAKKENITVEPADMDKELAQMAMAYHATVQQVKKIMRDQDREEDFKDTVRLKKTAQYIIDNIAQ